jgi:glycosyltransferase involved in cell wall biosynthesis
LPLCIEILKIEMPFPLDDPSLKQILTIAIPTYNRSVQIQKQVRLLLPQLNENVCLVVYDNFSDIPTAGLFTDEELSKFHLIRNKVNVGGDANIARCFENCSTKWLWTLSDDDYIKANAVEIVFDEINKSDQTVFVNFLHYAYCETVGFEELINKFKKDSVYSGSFTMSSCVYNMAKLRYSLIDYYSNLSSMVGTIILVLKYVQRHAHASCILANTTPIDKYNTEVGWNYGDYIRRNKIFIDAFGGKNNRKLNNTLFVGCHKTSYNLIIWNPKEAKMTYAERWKAYHQTIINQGFFNALKYTPKRMIYAFLCLILKNNFTIGFLAKRKTS